MQDFSVKSLIDRWPTRKAFAVAVGCNEAAVHKWASSGRIPSRWQWRVLEAARMAGHDEISPEWMLRAHDPARGPGFSGKAALPEAAE